jgi:hypothetical protein
MHVGQCHLERGVDGAETPVCDGADAASAMPYLSSKLETISHEGDLYHYWSQQALSPTIN